MSAISLTRGRLSRARLGRRADLWLVPVAFALHVLEESGGFTGWVQRHGRPDYTPTDFVQINATGLLLTVAATMAATRRPGRRLFVAYYALILTQQTLFNPVFHVGSTVAFRDWSPARRRPSSCSCHCGGISRGARSATERSAGARWSVP